MIKGVVFDLDHTLFDRYATMRKVLPEMYRRMRDKIPDELSVEEFICGVIREEKQHIYMGWNYTAQKLIEQGIFLNNTDGEEIWHCLYTYCWTSAAVKFPFTEPTFLKLKEMGLKLGILTNGYHDCQIQKIKLLGLQNFVDEIVISGDVGVDKPEKKPFTVMSDRLGIAPENLLYVGDNPLNDVEGSRNAGYIPVWVKTLGNWYFEDVKRCDYEVDTVAEIPEIVNIINNQ